MPIVITGNAASGKSAVCRMLSERGYKVDSADRWVHHFLAKPEYRRTVCARLSPEGRRRVDDDFIGAVRHDMLYREAFQNWYLPWIYDLVHAAIRKQLMAGDATALRPFFIEIPLYFEHQHAFEGATGVWLVWAPKTLRHARWQRRDGEIYKDMKKVDRFLWPYAKKFHHSDIILANTGDEADLERQVDAALAWTLKHSSRGGA